MKRYKKILIFMPIVVMTILALWTILDFFYPNTPSQFKKKSSEIIKYDEASDCFILPKNYEMQIPADLLSDYSDETVRQLKSKAEAGTLTNKDWHTATGYSLAAFLDSRFYHDSVSTTDTGSDSFTLGFVGDVCLSHDEPYPESPEGMEIIDSEILDEMKRVNLLFANNECPFSERGAPIKWKWFNFCTKPDDIKYIKELGIDVLTLANNHAYDYGLEAFNDTLDTIDKNGIYRVGAGENFDEASKPISFIINGYKVSCFSACSAEFPLQRRTVTAKKNRAGIMGAYNFGIKLKEQIKKENAKSDFIIVYMHWGIERTTFLTPWQRLTARQYIRAGASAILGSHPHIIQGIEFYHNSPIIYSLGNFWFDMDSSRKRIFAELEVSDDDFEVKIIPCKGCIKYPDKETRKEIFDYIVDISPWKRIKINDDGKVTVK